MKKFTIALDLDGVVWNVITPVLKKLQSSKQYTDIHSYYFGKEIGKTQEEMYNAFAFLSPNEITPYPNAVSTIHQLSATYDVFFLSCQTIDQQKWGLIRLRELELINPVFFCQNYREKANSIYSYDILLDDSPYVFYECKRKNRNVLLFDQPWNQSIIIPKHYRIFSWLDFLDYLEKQRKK